MRRREFFAPALGSVALFTSPQLFSDLGSSGKEAAAMLAGSESTGPATNRPEVAMLLYPGLTFLDLVGPCTVLARAANVRLVWKDLDLITVDLGITVKPNCRFEECPANLDVLFTGGGPGQLSLMQDRACLDFLRDRGSRARYVTSVCSGSLLLAAAGLLRGYKATSHWAYRDLLPLFGAEPVNERVVVDRNCITGGGVTAGIDFGLTLLSILAGERTARSLELGIEYDPRPPFDSGTPEKAGPEITQAILKQLSPRLDKIREIARMSDIQ